MVDSNTQLLTADDLLNLPRGIGERYELIEGRLIPMAPAGFEHGNISARAIYYLTRYAIESGRGRVQTSETGYRIRRDSRTVRAADASFMSYERVPASEKPVAYLDIAPELVLEVTSPNDKPDEIEKKVREWLDFGVLIVLVAYPDTQRLHVFRAGSDVVILTVEDTFEAEAILPGFTLHIRDLFGE
jgi:Uma2 family endonuclease